MSYSKDDERFMSIALQEAQNALDAGDYPVGAVLVVDGELWGQARNSMFTDSRTIAHAEHNLIDEFSARLRQKRIGGAPDYPVWLYTTLEPCLMCFGTAVMHHVSRIIVACPDPNGGTTHLARESLGSAYQTRWPEMTTGLYQKESCNLIIKFLKSGKFQGWESMLKQFEEVRQA